MLSGPYVEVEAKVSSKNIITGLDQLDSEAQSDVLACLNRLNKKFPGKNKAEVTLRKIPPQHVGLGTKTAVLLGVIKAISMARDIRLSQRSLQRLSGRGGTSGIGINIFFQGGFLVDGGHESGATQMFAPSSANSPRNVPPVICQAKIPSRWRFYLILPKGKRIAGKAELEFFRENTPIPKEEVLAALATVYHGVAPAVLTNNLPLLKTSLSKLHKVGFKKRELERQSEEVKGVVRAFDDVPKCAVGLSSMGPLVYIIADQKNRTVVSTVGKTCEEYKANLLGVFRGRNRGFQVIQ